MKYGTYGLLLLPLALAIAPAAALAASVTVPDDPGVAALLEPEEDIFAPIPTNPGTAETGIFTLPMERRGLDTRPPTLTDPMRSVRPESEWARPGDDEVRAQTGN